MKLREYNKAHPMPEQTLLALSGLTCFITYQFFPLQSAFALLRAWSLLDL